MLYLKVVSSLVLAVRMVLVCVFMEPYKKRDYMGFNRGQEDIITTIGYIRDKAKGRTFHSLYFYLYKGRTAPKNLYLGFGNPAVL